MNDFFSHLVARSFDSAQGIEVVRPRLPGLFEPVLERPGNWFSEELPVERRVLFETVDGESPGRIAEEAPLATVRESPVHPAPTPPRSAPPSLKREKVPPEESAPVPEVEEPAESISTRKVPPLNKVRPAENEPRWDPLPVKTEFPRPEPTRPTQEAMHSPEPASPVPLEASKPVAAEAKAKPAPLQTATPPRKAEKTKGIPQAAENTELPRGAGKLQEEAGEKPRRAEPSRPQINVELRVEQKGRERDQPVRPLYLSRPLQVLFDAGREIALRKTVSKAEPAAPNVLAKKNQQTERIQPFRDLKRPLVEDRTGETGPRNVRPVIQPIRAVFESRKTTVLRNEEPKPEPTINVTIGRVEVRAVTPAKVERRRTTSSSMSLKEYLSGRRGGR